MYSYVSILNVAGYQDVLRLNDDNDDTYERFAYCLRFFRSFSV